MVPRPASPARRAFPSPTLIVLLTLGVLLGSGSLAAADDATRLEPLELDARAFDMDVEIEVHGLTKVDAEAAARAAFRAIQETEAAVGRETERLNQGSSEQRTLEVEPPVLDLLERAQQFCIWSRGAHGPLGGNVYAYWDRAAQSPRPPPLPPFAPQSAACDRLRVDTGSKMVTVAAGSRVDLRGFAAGFAVDRAIERLRQADVLTARVAVGRVARYLGTGPAGDGWPVVLPVFEGYERPLDTLSLGDRSMALIWRAEAPAGHAPYVDLRTGRMDENTWVTIAVTELAVDAQALSVAAFVLGSREGRFRAAVLNPEPSILWILGSGQGRGLLTDHQWGSLATP